jgi:chromate transporter
MLLIFAGAPFVEQLRSNQRLSGALAAITAAVVGVILNLALYLGLHVLFREVGALQLGPIRPSWPVWASLDPAAFALATVAAVALLRYRIGMVATLALCCGLGLVFRAAWPI